VQNVSRMFGERFRLPRGAREYIRQIGSIALMSVMELGGRAGNETLRLAAFERMRAV
jgi:hypothetical protein